ncbi:MAG: Dabb family protein [Burkholderiales bacterium]|nr:Dabb family protein [Burkholderiales bacterium]
MAIQHLVLLRFTPSTPADEIAACMKDFAELPKQIGGILAFECGADVSPEGQSKGFTHAAIVTFVDAAARDAYLPHPAHLAFVGRLKPCLADVLVFDFVI